MKMESFLICDAASDYQGKLCVLGAFDTIFAKEAPVIHPSCSIAARIRFSKLEDGDHKIRMEIVDEDGHKAAPPMDGNIRVKTSDSMISSVVNLILNLQRLKFEKFGEYCVRFQVDGNILAELPVYLRKMK